MTPAVQRLCTLFVVPVLQIQYFSRAFQPLKNSFVETLRAVVLSVRWFLVLLLLTLWGFAGELASDPKPYPTLNLNPHSNLTPTLTLTLFSTLLKPLPKHTLTS